MWSRPAFNQEWLGYYREVLLSLHSPPLSRWDWRLTHSIWAHQPQISEKERDVELSSLFKDVASIIAEKCVNPRTQRPYTITMIERALRDCHFSVDPKRSAKQQALQAGSEASSGALASYRCLGIHHEAPCRLTAS